MRSGFDFRSHDGTWHESRSTLTPKERLRLNLIIGREFYRLTPVPVHPDGSET